MLYDTTHLLKLLREHSRLPAASGFDDEACLRALTAQLHGYILPLLKKEWQGYWASADACTTEVELVEGQAEYSIPARAVSASIQKAVLIGPQGQRIPLTYLETERREELPDRPGTPGGYTVRGNRLYLYPAPTGLSGYRLRLPMLVRPAALVLPSRSRQVLAVDTGTGVLTLASAAPADFLTAEAFDVVRGSEPYEAVLLEAEGTFGIATEVEFSTSAAAQVRVGDWLCLPGESPFPQCPVELLNLLAQRTGAEQLAGIGDGGVASAKAAPLGEMRQDARAVIVPRTGEPRLRRNGMSKWRGNGGHGMS